MLYIDKEMLPEACKECNELNCGECEYILDRFNLIPENEHDKAVLEKVY